MVIYNTAKLYIRDHTQFKGGFYTRDFIRGKTPANASRLHVTGSCTLAEYFTYLTGQGCCFQTKDFTSRASWLTSETFFKILTSLRTSYFQIHTIFGGHVHAAPKGKGSFFRESRTQEVTGPAGMIRPLVRGMGGCFAEAPHQSKADTYVTVYDADPPVFTDTLPASGSGLNPPDTTVKFSVTDKQHTALLNGSLNISINGVPVVSEGAVVCPSSFGTLVRTVEVPYKITYELVTASGFGLGETVSVSGQMADAAMPSNQGSSAYSFRIWNEGTVAARLEGLPDNDPPFLISLDPAPSQMGVQADSPISISLGDNATGVNLGSVQVIVSEEAAVLNGQIQDTFSGTVLPNAQRGYDIYLKRGQPFAFGETVSLHIQASDNYSFQNALDLETVFSIKENSQIIISDLEVASVSGWAALQAEESITLPSGTNTYRVICENTEGAGFTDFVISVNGQAVIPVINETEQNRRYEVIFDLDQNYRTEGLIEITVFESDLVYKKQIFNLLWGVEVEFIPEGLVKEDEINLVYIVRDTGYSPSYSVEYNKYKTEPYSESRLAASVYGESPSKAAVSGTVTSNNPYFERGKEMVLEFEASDFSGNRLYFPFKFTIER